MDIESNLEEIDFKPIEAKLYMYLLKNGASSQQDISDNAQILRQTVYELVAKMERKGYITSTLIKKRKIYMAVQPKILLQRFKEKCERFETVIPQMEKMQQPMTPLISETFIGMDGLKNLFSMTLDSKSEILWLANEHKHNELFQDYYWLNYGKKRAEKKIPIKLLVNSNTQKHFWKTDKKESRHVKSLSFTNNIDSSFVVYDDKIILYSLIENNLQGVYIQNPALMRLFKSIFMDMWMKGKSI